MSTSSAAKSNAGIPDAAMLNTAVLEAQVFSECWTAVESLLDFCLQHDPPEIKAWFDASRYIATYTLVYKYCVAPRKNTGSSSGTVFFHGEKLYNMLRQSLDAKFGQVLQELQQKSPSAVADYMSAWNRMVVLARHVEATFLYVERHWVERQLQLNRSHATPDVLRIRHLVYVQWNNTVVKGIIKDLLDEMSQQLTKERQIHSLQFDPVLRDLISSFMTLSFDIPSLATLQAAETSLIKTYGTTVLPAYLEWLAQHFRTTVATIALANGMDCLRATWEEEKARASYYLLGNSLDSIAECANEHLFKPCASIILSSFEHALNNAQTTHCFDIFTIMELQPEVLKQLEKTFERFCYNQLMLIEGDFVEGALSLYRQLTEWFKGLGQRESLLTNARDNAFRSLLNQSQYNASEHLAAASDRLLSGEVLSAERELLNEILAMFRLISDKESFRAHYTRFLSIRLLFGKVMRESEEQFIEGMRETCGIGFVGNLQKMLSDHVGFRDINGQYNYSSTDTDQKGFFEVVASGYWPLAPPCSDQPFTWPSDLKKSIDHFGGWFTRNHKRMRLEWIPKMSKITLKMTEGDHTTTVILSAWQYAILKPLLLKDSFMSAATISKACGLPPETVKDELDRMCSRSSLVICAVKAATSRAGYAIDPKPLTDETVNLFAIGSENFGGSSTVDSVDDKATGIDGGKTSEDRLMLIKAAIVRTAKQSNTIGIAKLVSQVQSCVDRWLRQCPAEEVMACIEQCIEKEYIRRSSLDTIRYIP